MTPRLVRTEQLDLLGHGWWDVRSADDVYRYEVGHRFGPGPLVGFTGINPSTGTAGDPDATMRKWTGFAKRWGFGGWVAVNPFALRSKDVKNLLTHRDPVGPGNDDAIRAALAPVEQIVACWGNPPSVRLISRLERTAKLLDSLNISLVCIGKTDFGHPKHLLMAPYSSQREVFSS